MIYELKTYDLQPHSVPEVERRFAEAYQRRRDISPMAAEFHTEIGPLNQVVQIWPYRDINERDRLTTTLAGVEGWPGLARESTSAASSASKGLPMAAT